MKRFQKGLIKRKEILSHFYNLIMEDGLEGASFGKIAKVMDIAPSLIIHHFSNKEGLMYGLIEHVVETYSNQVIPDFSETEDPQERWEDVIDVVSQLQLDRFIDRSVFYACYSASLRNKKFKDKLREFYRNISIALVVEIEFASHAGVVEINNPEFAAEAILSIVEGFNFYHHISPFLVGVDARSERIKTLIRGLCKGYQL